MSSAPSLPSIHHLDLLPPLQGTSGTPAFHRPQSLSPHVIHRGEEAGCTPSPVASKVSASPIQEAPTVVKKRRKRQALSCTECKRRKIKCDRTHPCTPCRKRDEPQLCMWEGAEPTGTVEEYVTKEQFDLLQERVTYLEGLIRDILTGALPRLHTQDPYSQFADLPRALEPVRRIRSQKEAQNPAPHIFLPSRPLSGRAPSPNTLDAENMAFRPLSLPPPRPPADVHRDPPRQQEQPSQRPADIPPHPRASSTKSVSKSRAPQSAPRHTPFPGVSNSIFEPRLPPLQLRHPQPQPP